MTDAVHTTTGWAILKNAAYIPALLIGLSSESYLVLTIFMFADLFLGVMRVVVVSGHLGAAEKNCSPTFWCVLHIGGQQLKSYKFVAGFISKLTVLSVPLIVVWAGRGAGFDFTILGQGTIGALVLAQAYSMLGHINAMRVKRESTEWDAVSDLIGGLQRRLRAGLEAILADGHNQEK